MTYSSIRALVISLSLVLLALSSLIAAEELLFDGSADTAYLPYRSVLERQSELPRDCNYPENNVIEVVGLAIKGRQDGLLILGKNTPPNQGGISMFTPRVFPGWNVTDDDPINYVITNWTAHAFANDTATYIVGVCHNDDSIFAFKVFVDSDSVEYTELYHRESEDDPPLVPNAHILYIGDFGTEHASELLLSVELPRHSRVLYLLDFESLNLRWTRSVASGIKPFGIEILERGEQSRILFVTANPANGVTDSIYNDRFSYLSVLDRNGQVIENHLASLYLHRPPVFIRTEIDDQFFVTHYLDFETGDSIRSKSAEEYYLSRVDASGTPIRSTKLSGIPTNMWLMRYGDTNELRLFVLFGSKIIEMYDLELSLLSTTKQMEHSMVYSGRFKIAGVDDSVYVFNDGLYDKNLIKLLQFPFKSSNFQPVEFDTLGNVTAYMIVGSLKFYIGQIVIRSTLEQVSVFYHRHKNYVMVFLAGLLAALVTTNVFRKRAKANLLLISSQKVELEKTHQSLKEAQAKIVSQEKFEQAKDIAGGFAHEIRNALSPARNALSKLLPMTGAPAGQKKTQVLAELTNRGVIRALELTRHISDYTKLESLKSPEPVRLTTVVDDVLQSYEKIIEEHLITVTWDPSDSPMIQANTDQLRIVITNLVGNAIEAMQSSTDRRLSIVLSEAGNFVELSVTDNGCGIPVDDRERVFDFFYSTKPDTGTGIGLAISKRIIELYDGTISVDSSGSGKTTFTVRCLRVS